MIITRPAHKISKYAAHFRGQLVRTYGSLVLRVAPLAFKEKKERGALSYVLLLYSLHTLEQT
jgi:hypothetical protein